MTVTKSPSETSKPAIKAASLPKFLEKLIYLTLSYLLDNSFITSNVLSVEPSLIKKYVFSRGSSIVCLFTSFRNISSVSSSLYAGTIIESLLIIIFLLFHSFFLCSYVSRKSIYTIRNP